MRSITITTRSSNDHLANVRMGTEKDRARTSVERFVFERLKTNV